MKKFISTFLTIILILGVAIFLLDDSELIENVGDETYTVMVYMCASDLESDCAMATSDITEMLDGFVDEKLNLIIQTGGTAYWHDYDISSDRNQRYKVEDEELVLIDDNIGQKDMTDPKTLADFIAYSKENYPADNYALILWDHGGGSLSGFGVDENFDYEKSMTIDKINNVLDNSNINFEFIGFDACLMATVENAYMLSNNGKYLIASEETEPGTGWEYTSLVNEISSNTSADAKDIAIKIVDEFIDINNGFFSFDESTLSVVDLSKMNNVYEKLTLFLSKCKTEMIDQNKFAYISKAVGKTKAYAEGECDTIDLVNLAENIETDSSDELIKAINEAVVYNKCTDLVENSNGLSIYVPYTDLESFSDMIKIYSNIGIGHEYQDFMIKFVNMLSGGKRATKTPCAMITDSNETIQEDYSDEDWYDSEFIQGYQDYYNQNQSEDLAITEKGDDFILEISDEQWENINNITCEVMYDDGEGYIDLGIDDYYETDENDNLIVNYDGTWVSLNGQVVPFYVTESTEKISRGVVPALLNDEEIEIVVQWDTKNEDGIVLGYTESYGENSMTQKGYKKFNQGDKIEFIFDYYTYDGEYDDSYIIGDAITFDDELKVSYEDVGDGEFYVVYKITDIYNNEFYTEPVIVY